VAPLALPAQSSEWCWLLWKSQTLQAPYAGITRSGSVGRRTRAVVRTPPSQPTVRCELPKVFFGSLMLASRRGSPAMGGLCWSSGRPTREQLIASAPAWSNSAERMLPRLIRQKLASDLVSPQWVVRCSPRHAGRRRDSRPHDLGH